MNIVDTLISEYLARDNASSVIERIAQANDRLHATIQRVIGAFAALNVAQRALDFKSKAEEAASSYISLEARLKALVGTAQDAQRKLRMAELVAAPSPFTTKQLADAAVTLEAFRVNSERVLPILGKLGAAMGASDERMEMYTRGIGMLAQGKMIEAEVLAAMGMSRSDFAAHGVQFDSAGQLKSSANDALVALEKIVNERFGHILEQMADTPEAKRASLEDAGEKAMRSVGVGFLKAAAPFMDSWTKVITSLTNSGVLDETVQKLTRAFLGIFGGDSSEGLARFAAKILAFFYDLPENLTKIVTFAKGVISTIFVDVQRLAAYFSEIFHVATTNVGLFFENMHDRYAGVIQFIVTTTKIVIGAIMDIEKAIFNMLNTMYGIWIALGGKVLVGVVKQIAEVDKMLFDVGNKYTHMEMKNLGLEKDVPAPKYLSFPAFPALQSFPGLPQLTSGSKADEFTARLVAGLRQGQPQIPDTTNQPFLKANGENKTLERIMNATEKTADNTRKELDIHQILFGGGDRARAGVSILDISPRTQTRAVSPRGPVKIDVKAGPAASYIERGIIEVLRQNLPLLAQALAVEGYH